MVYENLRQLLDSEITFVAESNSRYYVRTKPEEYFDVSMWAVDKDDGAVSYMEFTTFLSDHLDQDAFEIDVKKFRSRFNEEL